VDGFKGDSPVRVYIPKKPHPNGHLFYEAVSLSKANNLPYLYRFFPHLEDHRPSTTDVYEKLLSELTTIPHIINDTWFLSKDMCLHCFCL
jgi:hypothetical protein